MSGKLPAINFDTNIVVIKGSLIFKDSDVILERAEQIRDYVSNITVTEDTIKNAQKLVTSLNKEVKALNDNRISAKKQLLAPYFPVESKVKEISGVANEASEFLKKQIRVFEEKEREEKKETLIEIFEKRKSHYDYNELFLFDDYFQERFLNKTFKLSSAEQEMVEWFERRKNDLIAISSFEPEESVEYINAYFNDCDLDLAKTIGLIQRDRQNREKVKEVVKSVKSTPEIKKPIVDEYVCYRVDKSKARIVEEMFKNANIKFEKI